MERNNPNRAKLISKTRGFGLVVQTPGNIKPVGYKWVFGEKKKMRMMKS